MAPPSVRTPTFGEGDGPEQTQDFLNLEAPDADTISNLDVETAFATTLTFTGVDSGDGLRITARGFLGTAAGGSTLQITLKHGSSIIIQTATTLVTGNLSNRGWWLEAFIVAGLSEVQGTLFIAGTTNPVRDLVNTTRVGIGLTTGTFSLLASWGTADPANTITLRQFSLERILAP